MKSLKSILNESDCQNILDNVFGKSATTFSDYDIQPYGEIQMGSLAEHYRLILNCIKDGNKEKVSFFLKTSPLHNEKQKKCVKKMGVFSKEIKVYMNLVNPFLKLVDFPFAPECYFTKNEEVIVLEDMTAKTYHSTTTSHLTLKQAKEGLRCLARFHGASLISEEKIFKKKLDTLFDKELEEATFSFTKGHVRYMWLLTVTDTLKKLSKFFTDDKQVPENLEKYIMEKMPTYLQPSQKYRNVLTHDDLWKNNIMFNDNDDCAIVDFQLTRYTPPAFDVALFLVLNVEREYLVKNWINLLKFYYTNLGKVLKRHNIPIKDIITEENFLESAEEYKLPALVEACMYCTHVLIPQRVLKQIVKDEETFQNFVFVNRADYILKEFETDNEYKTRFSEVLKPLYSSFVDVVV